MFDLLLVWVQDSEIGASEDGYEWYMDEVSFPIDPSFHKRINRKEVVADFCFVNRPDNAVILMEETEFPEKKVEQLLAYCCLDFKSVQNITKADSFPTVDVFLIVPFAKRSSAMSQFKKLEADPIGKKGIGGRIGLTAWYWTKGKKRENKIVKVCGMHKSANLKALPGTFSLRGDELRIPILRSAPPIELLRYLHMKMIENELGEKNPFFDREKTKKWLRGEGIYSEKKIREAFKLGEEIGTLEHVDLTNLYAEPKYAKDHPRSVNLIKDFIADPFGFMGGLVDESQSSIEDYYETENDDSFEDE